MRSPYNSCVDKNSSTKEKIAAAKKLLGVLDDATIAYNTGLTVDEVTKLRNELATK